MADYEYRCTIQLTNDGGYIVAGPVGSNDGDVTGNHGGMDVWLVKLDAAGVLQWQRCLGGSAEELPRSIQQTTDGGYIIAGKSNSTDGDVDGLHGGAADAWVVKVDATGTIQWQKCLGGSELDWAWSIQQTNDGGYVMAGHTRSNDGDVSGFHIGDDGADDAWVVRLDTDGTMLWQKCLGGSAIDAAYSIQQTLDGGYLVAGLTTSNDGDVSGWHGGAGASDIWLVKLDVAGNIQWQKCLGGTSNDWTWSTQQVFDGGYVVSGYTHSNNGDVSGNHGGVFDAWVAKLDSVGGLEWQKCLGGSGGDWAFSIRQNVDSSYVVGGCTTSNDDDVVGNHGGVYDAWIVKLDNGGVLLWQKCLGGADSDGIQSIQQCTDGGYVATGWTSSNDGDVSGNHGSHDVWVVKLGPDEFNTGMAEPPTELFSISPNPTYEAITIGFAPNARPRAVLLLDAMARTVSVQSAANASGSITLDLTGHERGLYIVQVRFADGTLDVERVVKE
jgi:hypothetical protein